MDLVDVLERLGVDSVDGRQDKHGRAGWRQCHCPRCPPSKSRHLGINIKFGYANCWRCGRVSLAGVLTDLSHKPYKVVKELVDKVRTYDTEEEASPTGTYTPPAGAGPLGPIHTAYLASRGFVGADVAALWGVGGVGRAARLGWRLFIPVFKNGKPVSWTTRIVSDTGGIRYYAAPPDCESAPISSLLYGEDYCRHSVIIHEGPVDVWATGPGAVATFGLSYSSAQVRRLSRYPIRVVCYDNQPVAQVAAMKLVRELSAFPGKTYNVVLSGKDAATSPREEIAELRSRFLGDC